MAAISHGLTISSTKLSEAFMYSPLSTGLPRGRVLVCDDSATVRTVIKSILSPVYDCLVVVSAEEALAQARDFLPDLLISDLMMGGMTGFQLCERARDEPALRNVPIVLLTSVADEESRAIGLEVGATDYLTKPPRARALLARAKSLIQLRRSTAELERRTAELETINQTLTATQKALVHAEKLATMGTLVAGIAHEINNPLAFMKSGAETASNYCASLRKEIAGDMAQPSEEQLRSRLESLTEIDGIAAEIMEGTLRLQRIAASLKSFGESGRAPNQTVDIAEEVGRAWKLAEARTANKPSLVLDLEPGCTAHSAPHLIGQVLLNIFVNAVQAMTGPGRVTVRAATEYEQIVIRISDSGPGIPQEILRRVFDPFFTTKAPGMGTGLGLSVSYGIMQSLGGTIEAASPSGAGAVFTLRIPRKPRAETYNSLRSQNLPTVAA